MTLSAAFLHGLLHEPDDFPCFRTHQGLFLNCFPSPNASTILRQMNRLITRIILKEREIIDIESTLLGAAI